MDSRLPLLAVSVCAALACAGIGGEPRGVPAEPAQDDPGAHLARPDGAPVAPEREAKAKVKAGKSKGGGALPAEDTSLRGLAYGSTDVAPPDPAFPPHEVLSLAQALWGVDLPNILKGVSVAWDGGAGRLYVAGIATDRLAVVDPARGHPVSAIDLEVDASALAMLRVDEARRRLFWVTRTDGAIRVVDLASQRLTAKANGPRLGVDPQAYATRDAAIDPATGWIWVANMRGASVTGYSPDVASTASVPGLQAPVAIEADPKGDLLYILDAPDRETSRLLKYQPSTGAAQGILLPRGAIGITLSPRGELYAYGRRISSLDAQGRARWATELPAMATSVVATDSLVAVLMQKGNASAGKPEALVTIYDAATGAEKARLDASYESQSMAADLAGSRLFVGNGGDGSVDVVDLARLRSAGRYDVCNAAEHLVVDPKTGARYVLSRLGGSELYAWPKGGRSVTRMPAGRWPSDLALDSKRRRLYALTHYDAAIQAWDLDTNAPQPPLSLGLERNASDTLGDLDLDEATGLVAAVFPETGSLAVADMSAGKVLWKKQIPELRAGEEAGPGNAYVAIDGSRGKLYVASGKEGMTVTAYDLRSGAPGASASLPQIADGYGVNTMWLDEGSGRLFVGPHLVSVPQMALATTLRGVKKVIWVDGERLLGLMTAARRDKPELLVELDPKTYAIRASRPLVPTRMMNLNATYDPASRTVYALDMAEARVMAFRWPQ